MTAKNRDAVRDAAVDGDCCFTAGLTPGGADGAGNAGQVQVEAVENTRVYFGNPQVWEVQKQPYIIVSLRQLLSTVREEAEANGNPTPGALPRRRPQRRQPGAGERQVHRAHQF